MSNINIAAIIPARLSSSRFPRKVLYPICNLPMVEHVRRRAIVSSVFSRVVVATCDSEIYDLVTSFGGDAVLTSNDHISGTSRVIEAVSTIDCSHVVLLQGDEPLVLPRHLQSLVNSIYSNPDVDAWNLVSPLIPGTDLDAHSTVKAIVGNTKNILYCFRRSPFYGDILSHDLSVQQLLGIMAFRSDFLKILDSISPSNLEKCESIEQLKILDNGFPIQSLSVHPALPSVNYRIDLESVLSILSSDIEQINLNRQIISLSSFGISS